MATERSPVVPLAVPLSRREACRRWLLDLRETERRCLLLAHDVAVLAVATATPLALTGLWPASWPLAAGWVAVAVLALYSTEQYALRPHHDRALELSVGLGALAAMAYMFTAGLPLLALPAWLTALGLSGLALPAGRRLLDAWLSGPLTRRRLLIFGTPNEALEVHAELRRHPLANQLAVGLVLSRGQLPQPFPLLALGTPPLLSLTAAEWAADGVVAGLEALQSSGWHRRLPTALAVTDLPTLCARLSGRVPLWGIDERWFVEHFRWRRGWGYRGATRAIDVLVAAIALLSLAPLMAAIALTLRLTGGSVLVVEPHLGRGGRPFALASFRTVHVGPGGYRATRPARWLRATRLHKLPHLWSVLRGDMALVGPSPHPVALGAELASFLPHYARRHLIKPGLTGWAQVRDPFGPPLRETERVLGFDLFYVYRRSLRLDAVIALRTVFLVLARLTAPRR
jgi:lipopolysaccharide/colanic/teichoic acid biosynthesis glycosyltransferase